MSSYHARPLIPAAHDLTLPLVGSHAVGALNLESAATELMTDLRHIPAIRISEDHSLAAAQAQMVAAGVRLLFVVNSQGSLLGLVTAYDLAGEKPLMLSMSREANPNLHAPNEVRVRDIMQPVAGWRGVDFSSVVRARVGDVVETFRQTGQPHLLVFETSPGETPVVRGIFSATQFERVLGIRLELTPRAGSFAEIEQMLSQP